MKLMPWLILGLVIGLVAGFLWGRQFPVELHADAGGSSCAVRGDYYLSERLPHGIPVPVDGQLIAPVTAENDLRKHGRVMLFSQQDWAQLRELYESWSMEAGLFLRDQFESEEHNMLKFGSEDNVFYVEIMDRLPSGDEGPVKVPAGHKLITISFGHAKQEGEDDGHAH